MDTFFFRSAFFVFFTLVAGACMASEPEPPVAVNVQGLPQHVADPIRAHAAKGLTELRRYLERTRMIHLLRIEYIVRTGPETALANSAPPKVEVVVAKKTD
jgi:hypothetical protein